MINFKIELYAVGAALFLLGAFFVTRPIGAEAAAPPSAVLRFTESDFAAFDRAFPLHGEECAVGLRRQRTCFNPSPLEDDIVSGMALPASVPILPAEFTIILRTDLKADGLRTVRFGRTLVLIDPQTRRIVDVIVLNADDFDSARPPPI